ncbi:ATP-DEPENDENT CLP PROTEASE ATP-BINDING SUBUNIT CLPT2 CHLOROPLASTIC [Salix viminalis]|uniref:Clp R domain-containing protein n=2 Tax=Salix TaxID=40685 RepID=A0A5N5P4G7_9ROSI|nr:hypothetical protein DKX38_000860 [Salix brachista]KAJ6714578.1 ATP-DEPENDENT CLP PROTEASE ATP-BINDING SUBUNIT CLPT2 CHLOROPLASTIC [Salix viminalis]
MAANCFTKLPNPSSTTAQQALNRQQHHHITQPNSLLLPPHSLKPFTSLPWPRKFLTTHLSTRLPVSATVLSSLPTAKPERFASFGEKVPRWSWRAIKAFTMAELEARKLKFANTGTEALLLGILIEGTSVAAKYLWANGITVFKVREETIKVLGKADMYYFPPERPPLTDDAQKVLDLVLDRKLKSGDSGEVTTSDLLLGIWSEVESPGHKILAVLGFNDEKAKELEASSSGPGFIDG